MLQETRQTEEMTKMDFGRGTGYPVGTKHDEIDLLETFGGL